MKEHIIFEKIEQYERLVSNKPISLLPNLLLLSYVALGKQYDKLGSYAEQFLMSNPKINILVEDFIMLSSIATNQTSFADISFRNIHSLDPEDPYAHLMRLVIESSLENMIETKLFLSESDLKKVNEFFKDVEIPEPYKLYRVPSVIGLKDNIVENIRKKLEEDPSNIILRVSLTEALLNTNNTDEAQKEIDTILSLYPNYTRALNVKAKLFQDYFEEEAKGVEIFKKIFELNPVSPYLKGIEIIFLSEDESIMANELKTVFKYDNPFITFFMENSKQKEKEIQPEAKEPVVNEEETAIKETEEIPEEELSPTDKGYKYLLKGNHKKAIESFLRELKKK